MANFLDSAVFDPIVFDSEELNPDTVYARYSATFFETLVYDTGDGVGPEQPLPGTGRRGIPINAYKQFKYIDKSGNTYYMKRSDAL